jgi:emfourin
MQLKIEKVGGLGGFGLPGSRIRSEADIHDGDLTDADRAIVDSLFANPPADQHGPPDAFRYRLTRQTDHGAQVIDVPEHVMPPSLKARVHDQLL